jgi:hypothetical protein
VKGKNVSLTATHNGALIEVVGPFRPDCRVGWDRTDLLLFCFGCPCRALCLCCFVVAVFDWIDPAPIYHAMCSRNRTTAQVSTQKSCSPRWQKIMHLGPQALTAIITVGPTPLIAGVAVIAVLP